MTVGHGEKLDSFLEVENGHFFYMNLEFQHYSQTCICVTLGEAGLGIALSSEACDRSTGIAVGTNCS